MTKKTVRWFFNFTKWEPTRQEILLTTSCIQTEEKDRLAKFVFKKDYKSSLIGRLMMRKFVHEVTNKPYNEIKFIRDEKGKPFLDNYSSFPELNFNVSHQGDYTVLAGHLGDDTKLGVDVMKLEYTGGRSLNEFFRIMNRNFAIQEWETIKSSGDEQKQIIMFCRYWCLKESYVKALGVGILVNLQDIVFKINTRELKKNEIINDTELYVKGRKEEWGFQEMLIGDEHCVAVASSCKNSENLLFQELTFENLIQNAIPFMNNDEVSCENFFKKLDKA